jgi:hypothetical protein
MQPAWTPVPAVLLRSTGFAFEVLDNLAPSELHDRCAQLAALRAEVRRLQDNFATSAFPQAVAALEAAGVDRATFRGWYKVRRQIERAEPVELPVTAADVAPEIARWLADWSALLARVAAQHAELEHQHTTAVGFELAALTGIVAEERFAEAVFLSSPSMYAALQRYPGRSGGREVIRRTDVQLYSYLQRFTTKNDTMSLYGPVDHGFIDPDPAAPPLALTVGETPPIRLTRTAYWAADALAATIVADPDVTPYLTPRLADGLSVDSAAGTLRNTASGRVVALSADDRILAAVDGHTTVGQLQAQFADDAGPALRSLQERRRLTITLRIPTAELDPMAWLHRWVSALPTACPARARWLPVIEEQLELASEFADAPLREKVALLTAVEDAFTAATGRPARRADGELYADRTLLFDEALGDVSCRIGPALLDDLTRRLTPVMQLCATYSLVVQGVCRSRARAVIANLGGRAPYLQFTDQLRRSADIAGCLAAPQVRDFLDSLYKLVDASTTGDQAVLGVDDVAELALPIPEGTVLSPDIFLASDSIAALTAGDFDVIVGEVHHGVQVWTHLTTFWPDREGLARALEDLLAAGGGNPSAHVPASFVHGRRQGKAFPMELPGYSIEFGGRSAKDPSLVIRVSELEVIDDGTDLVLWCPRLGLAVRPNGSSPHNIVNWIFGPPPVAAPPPPEAGTTPRLRVGGAVLWRRGWTLPGPALAAARAARTPADAQLLTTEVWQQHGLPRRSFVRFPTERKPVYCDIGDPLSVANILARAAGSSSMRLTELLPGPEQWWLPAAGGGRRSCEWRTTWIWGLHDA